MFNAMYWVSRASRKLSLNAVKNSTVDSTSKLEAGTTFIGSAMGRHSFCGYNCTVLNSTIGSFCSIANTVSIGIGGRHPVNHVSTSPVFLSHRDSVKAKFARFEVSGTDVRTQIGNDVWIGEGVRVKAGVCIGNGSIVGFGSVITKDVAPYSIVAGNPARVIKYRFSEDVIAQLEELKWWDWTDSELHNFGQYFTDPNILLAEVKKEANSG